MRFCSPQLKNKKQKMGSHAPPRSPPSPVPIPPTSDSDSDERDESEIESDEYGDFQREHALQLISEMSGLSETAERLLLETADDFPAHVSAQPVENNADVRKRKRAGREIVDVVDDLLEKQAINDGEYMKLMEAAGTLHNAVPLALYDAANKRRDEMYSVSLEILQLYKHEARGRNALSQKCDEQKAALDRMTKFASDLLNYRGKLARDDYKRKRDSDPSAHYNSCYLASFDTRFSALKAKQERAET